VFASPPNWVVFIQYNDIANTRETPARRAFSGEAGNPGELKRVPRRSKGQPTPIQSLAISGHKGTGSVAI